jgi:hypothetical protein
MRTAGERNVDTVAQEILRYLREHPAASDTNEGIAQWWLQRQRLEDALATVQSALDRLVEKGELEARVDARGQARYQLAGECGDSQRI